ncbi:hypothetical protein GCM10008929_13700 [Alkalibacterium psychrotolerans]
MRRMNKSNTESSRMNNKKRKRSSILAPSLISKFGRKLLLAVLVPVISIVAFMLYPRGAQMTETTIFVEQIQELAFLATAEAKVTLVKEEVDHKLFGKDIPINFIPGTQREILLIIPATVIAGVDLEKVTSEQIIVNEEEMELEIILPRATFIQDPAIQMDSIRTWSGTGLLRGEVKWDEGFDLAGIAQEEIKEEAVNMGILETAEKSAEKVLEGFFTNLGYKVAITYE